MAEDPENSRRTGIDRFRKGVDGFLVENWFFDKYEKRPEDFEVVTLRQIVSN